MATSLTNKPAANTAAVITIAAVSGVKHQIESIAWSYDATPTGGNVKIESPSGTTLFEQYVAAAAPYQHTFSGSCLAGAEGAAVVVTLAAGGGSVAGLINATTRS